MERLLRPDGDLPPGVARDQWITAVAATGGGQVVARKRVTPWAVVALVCALVSFVFMPIVFWIAGSALGVKALSEIESHPWLQGKYVALVAVVLVPVSVITRVVTAAIIT
jgi:hypothetical protein